MSGTSDIPDWCYVQAGVKYDPLSPPTAEDYAELLSRSPMSAFNKVQCTLSRKKKISYISDYTATCRILVPTIVYVRIAKAMLFVHMHSIHLCMKRT